MSQNFDNKNYGDYFKTLENNLTKNTAKKPETEIVKAPVSKPKVLNKKPKKRFFLTFRLRKSVIAFFLALVILIVGIIVFPKFKKSDLPAKNSAANNDTHLSEKVEKEEKISFNLAGNVAKIPQSNDAECAIVIDKETNTIIAERNAHKKAYPASTTKIMTLLVAAEYIKDLDAEFTMTLDITDPLYVQDASVAGFLNGETVTMRDLFYGMILPSGADAAMALALTVADSETAFVELMNKKVYELGLENTHFTNVTGLHNENNYSTVYDMAVILAAAQKDPFCNAVLSTYKYVTSKTKQHPNGIELASTLFTYMYGTEPETSTIIGGKTGFVNESGYCIASYGECNDNHNEYIVVTFGNSARMKGFFGQIDLYKEFAK